MLEMTRARIKMLLREPFFGHLALSCTLRETTDIPTMATDGKSILFNRKFVEAQTPDELIGVIAHEVMHNALLHTFRRNDREPKKWNAAADYATNGLLLEHGFSLPADRLYDPKYKGMSAEQIYRMLPAVIECPSWGSMIDPPSNDVSSLTELEATWMTNVKTAAEAEKSSGKKSRASELALHDAVPRVNWRAQLASIATELMKTNYAWYPCNQQYLQMGLHVPTLSEPQMGPLVIAIDTSGSIRKEELAAFLAEVNSLIETVNPRYVTVIYCDSSIKAVEEFEEAPITLTPVGGGGTDFVPVFNHIATMDEEPSALLYFTDLCVSRSDYPETQPDYPVYWVITEKHSPPWGGCVDIWTEN